MSLAFRRALVAVGVSLACLVPALAQEPPPLNQAVTVHVKPDRLADFLAIQTRFAEAARDRAEGFRGVWRSNNDTYKFVIITPRNKYADFDSGPVVTSTLPAAESTALIARIQQTIVSRKVEIRRAVPDALIWPTTVPRTVHVSEIHVGRGKQAQYEALVKQIAGEFKKIGMPGFGVARVRFGGDRSTYFVWRAIENMAHFDSPGWFAQARESMGEEAATKWIQGYGDALAGPPSHEIYSYQESLSYYPDQEQ
jgi:hypothetical protein